MIGLAGAQGCSQHGGCLKLQEMLVGAAVLACAADTVLTELV